MSLISFKPFKVTSMELKNLPIQAGQFMIVTDSQEIYLDRDNVTRTKVGKAIGEIPIGPASNVNAVAGDEQITVTWTDPEDIIIEDNALSIWAGTKLVLKENDYPTSPEDGTVVIDNKTKNWYSTAGYKIIGLTNGVNYYGRLFPYSAAGYINNATSNKFIATPTLSYPSVAMNIEVIGDSEGSKFIVNFDLPADAIDATIVMKEGAAPSNSMDGVAIARATSSVQFDNVRKNVTYYFKIYTYNERRRETESNVFTGMIEGLELVTFADGTDAEISAMLNAHYNGDINIGNYWSVGDERVIQLSATTANAPYSSVNHAAQQMTIVILDIEHDNLVTPVNGRTKAAITVGCKEMLGNNGTLEEEYYWGSSHVPVVNSDDYGESPLREYLNNDFKNSLPSTFRSMIKTVEKSNLATHISSSLLTISRDDVFLPSYPEVFGISSYEYYLSNGDVWNYEGNQYEYFKTSNHRQKFPNNNGTSEGVIHSYYWLLRSPSSDYFNDDTGYGWCQVLPTGEPSRITGNEQRGLAPVFAL